jgi:hypothetical protein
VGVTACEELARAADAVAAERPDWPAREFLVELAHRVAAIRRGPLAGLGLLLGGRSLLRGGGFRAELRDSTAGQARHFVGIARAVTVVGPSLTGWLSEHVRRDDPTSPDGRLTTLGIEFAGQLLDGSLVTRDAGEWIRTNVCASRLTGG